MKKCVSFLLVCAMLFSFCGLALAAPIDVGPVANTKKGVFQEPKVLTRQEVIERIMEAEGVSATEAELRLDEPSSVSVATGTIFVQATLNHDFGCGYTAEVGAVVEVPDTAGPGNRIVRVVTSWTTASGSGLYTWNEAYHLAEIAPQPYMLTLGARGSMQVEIDLSITGGAEMKSKLVNAGFSLSGSVGTKYYYRKLESWSGVEIF